jgi:hypothetical protein
MDVAIRAVNWVWAVSLAADDTAVTRPFLATFLASLLAHGRHVFNNLEVRDDKITTNHYLADIVGLLYLGLCLLPTRETARWRSFALRSLVDEMNAQVLSDGVHYESSLSYHRLATEMFLSGAMLCKHHGEELPQKFWSRLQDMCDFVMSYTKPNGLAPQIGDGDNGRLHILTGYGRFDSRDHRHLLALGALRYNRQDWLASAGPYWVEALWFGAHRQARWEKPTFQRTVLKSSKAFKAGGFYILRHEDDYVLFNCSPPGAQGIGTHKHNDVLSVEVHLGGQDILVDPGCFLYTSDPQAYAKFRSTRSHSTLSVDQSEQNRFIPGKLFCLHPDSRPIVRRWDQEGSVEIAVADHDGYERFADPVRHQREMRFDSEARSLSVIDRVHNPCATAGLHRLEWALIFAPGCRIDRRRGGGWVIATEQDSWALDGPVVCASGHSAKVVEQVAESEVAPSYGALQSAPCLRWVYEGQLPVESRFSVSPCR